MIDFSETTYRGFGRDPAFAQWSTKTSKDLVKYIPEGGRARFFLYSIQNDYGMHHAEYRYIRDGKNNRGKSRYSWSYLSDPVVLPHESDKGILKVIVSANPPLLAGSMVARLAFDGRSVSVIEGEVQIPK